MNIPQCVLDWICLPKCLPTCQICCGTNLVRKPGHGGMWTLCVCGAGWPDDKPPILSRPDSKGWWWRRLTCKSWQLVAVLDFSDGQFWREVDTNEWYSVADSIHIEWIKVVPPV